MDIVWKDVPNYEGLYKVSNMGDIFGFKRNKILTPCNGKDGYKILKLCKNGNIKTVYIHRVVASAFLENTNDEMQVNHINGIKTDNRASNLEYCTLHQNLIHSYKLGLKKIYPVAKLDSSTLQIIDIYDSKSKCAKSHNCSISEITLACRKNKVFKGFRWKQLENVKVNENYFEESEE